MSPGVGFVDDLPDGDLKGGGVRVAPCRSMRDPDTTVRRSGSLLSGPMPGLELPSSGASARRGFVESHRTGPQNVLADVDTKRTRELHRQPPAAVDEVVDAEPTRFPGCGLSHTWIVTTWPGLTLEDVAASSRRMGGRGENRRGGTPRGRPPARAPGDPRRRTGGNEFSDGSVRTPRDGRRRLGDKRVLGRGAQRLRNGGVRRRGRRRADAHERKRKRAAPH